MPIPRARRENQFSELIITRRVVIGSVGEFFILLFRLRPISTRDVYTRVWKKKERRKNIKYRVKFQIGEINNYSSILEIKRNCFYVYFGL